MGLPPTGFYRDLAVALLGGIVGSGLTLVVRMIGEKYRVRINRLDRVKSEILEPTFDDLSEMAKENYLMQSPKWEQATAADKMFVDDDLETVLDDFSERRKMLGRIQHDLVEESVFELPDGMTNQKNLLLPDHIHEEYTTANRIAEPNIRNWIQRHAVILSTAESPDELRDRLMSLSPEENPYGRPYMKELYRHWEQEYPEWNSTLYEITQSETFREWMRLRREIQEEALELLPELEYRIAPFFHRIRLRFNR